MRVGLAGASGFIGSHLRANLSAAGHEVVTIGCADLLGVPDAVAHVRWDLRRPPPSGLPALEVIVNAAGARAGADRDEIRAVAVDGLAGLLDAWPAARIVQVSCASVYDPFRPTYHAREAAAPVRRYLDARAAGHAAAEVLLAHRAREAVVLRPQNVYGPGGGDLLALAETAARAGVLALPHGGRARISVCSVPTLVAAVLAALTGPPGTYNVADAAPVQVADALGEVLRRRGARGPGGLGVRIVPLPEPAARRLGGALELAAAAAGRGSPRWLRRELVARYGNERTLDLTALRERLGVSPGRPDFGGAERW